MQFQTDFDPIIYHSTATLLVLVDFCPVQSEFLTWSFVTKTFDI